MSTFCLIAYIPCIILVIWLLIEFRKFIIVSKRLKNAEKAWDKLIDKRSRQRSKERFIETIPPPPPRRYSEYSTLERHPMHEEDDFYPAPSRDYDYDSDRTSHGPREAVLRDRPRRDRRKDRRFRSSKGRRRPPAQERKRFGETYEYRDEYEYKARRRAKKRSPHRTRKDYYDSELNKREYAPNDESDIVDRD
jgi:hypothetical protein